MSDNMSKLNIIHHATRYLLLSLLLIGLPAKVLAQPTNSTSSSGSQGASIFSIEGGKRLMTEADQAIEAQQYDLAVEKLQNARQVFNQLSNFYLQLFNSFTGLDNTAAESHRKKALDTSLERDRATYQLALVHRSQNKPELAIPLLIQIVTSQSPGIGLGKKAYEQLVEIGFVDTPYTPTKPGEVKSPVPPATPSTPIPNTNSSPAAQPIAPEAVPVAPTP
ncbi:MAG: tetratricopeptide repeat protein [Waterburya sp.]